MSLRGVTRWGLVLGVCSCSGVPSVSVGGAWTGRWSSGRGLSGAASATIQQSGGSVRGTFSLEGSPCVTGGTLDGTVDDRHMVVHMVSGSSRIDADLTVTSPAELDGTYEAVVLGFCTGDTGSLRLAR